MHMTQIIERIEEVIQDTVQLVIVSKMRTLEEMEYYYNRGYRDFGENKVQEIVKKKDWHADVRWHCIGRLQTNKVKDVVKHCCLVHSLSRYELMEAIEKEACKQHKIMPCLLQFNIAEEETKTGFMLSEMQEVYDTVQQYPHIHIKGIMCMGPHVEDPKQIQEVFQEAKKLFDTYKTMERERFTMEHLSMGMSKDYEIAVQEGSTMIRVGRALFEEV
ncbi:MAG: YggS family pyridoxal phosphate-dependent enzyme [Erysipelotrichaceae bacterium]|nr:YggS family pyridoxal phosphate-dependent enzyme [Erysipelotrichaceae bacterium]